MLARPARLGSVRLVAVDGSSGSGKTTFAAALADAVARCAGGTVVRPARTSVSDPARDAGLAVPFAPGSPVPDRPALDLSALDLSALDLTGPDSPAPGPLVAVVSTDLLATWQEPLQWWPLVEEHLLSPLADGRAAQLPVLRWVSGHPRPGGLLHVPVIDVLILEGVSAGRAAVTDRLSALIWVEVPDPVLRLERAVQRDGEPMREYLRRWQFQEAEHFAADGTAARADLVIHPS